MAGTVFSQGTALVVVDMQRYYLEGPSDYARYFGTIQHGCLDYIIERCDRTVVPVIGRLLERFRERGLPVIFLRLCGTDPERRDLHHYFRETYLRGRAAGFDGVYPLAGDPWAAVIPALAPRPGETVIDKTTFSPFTATAIDDTLRHLDVSTLVFTGLATSQCVETTARDAADRGYDIIHVEDGQADYDEMTHHASLYSSRGVCGGMVVRGDDLLADD